MKPSKRIRMLRAVATRLFIASGIASFAVASACTADSPTDVPTDLGVDSIARIVAPAKFVLRSANAHPVGSGHLSEECWELVGDTMTFTAAITDSGTVYIRHVVRRIRTPVTTPIAIDTSVIEAAVPYVRNRKKLELIFSQDRDSLKFEDGGSRLVSSFDTGCYPGRPGVSTLQGNVLQYHRQD